MKKECIAGIVLYNPQLERLCVNIESICNQVDKVVLFDNASKNSEDLKNKFQKYENVHYIYSQDNLGISGALNHIMQFAYDYGYQWVYTLDQDSISPDGLISSLLQGYNEMNNNNIAIVCPRIYDRRRPQLYAEKHKVRLEYIDYCITSGSLVRSDICQKLNGFDNWMFIDLVDWDYCKRVILNDYYILSVNSMLLDHELGNLTPSRYADFFLKIGNALGCESIKKLSYKREVSPFRYYYATRNMVYYYKKFKPYLKRSHHIKLLFKNCIFSVIRAEKKWSVMKSMFHGLYDGIKEKVSIYEVVQR